MTLCTDCTPTPVNRVSSFPSNPSPTAAAPSPAASAVECESPLGLDYFTPTLSSTHWQTHPGVVLLCSSASKPCTVTCHRTMTSWSYRKEIWSVWWRSVTMAGLLVSSPDLLPCLPDLLLFLSHVFLHLRNIQEDEAVWDFSWELREGSETVTLGTPHYHARLFGTGG